MLKAVLAVFIVSCALTSGCATGPSISESGRIVPALETGKARIYFYRTSIIGGAYQPEVTLNGAVVGRATPRAVYFRDVAPGYYSVTTSMTDEVVKFALIAGQRQFVRINYAFGFRIYPELIEVSVGEKEIDDLSYVAEQ